MAQEGSIVAVDWGSSHFRAFLLDANGTVVEKVKNSQGVFKARESGFKDVLYAACGRWFDAVPGLPVFICGMVGSREGWIETEYLKCPVTVDDLGKRLVRVPEIQDNPVFIVPGLSSGVFSFTDVMRGEETQVFGLPRKARGEGIACMPGTHSKWTSFDGDTINYFATFLTGELFSSIKTSGSIQPVIRDEDFDEDAFREGIRLSKTPGGLSHHLFSIRSRLVAGESFCGAHASYLSGLLIGAEISAGLALCPVKRRITLVGNTLLLPQYELAFSLFDIATVPVPSGQASVQGLWKLARISQAACSKRGRKRGRISNPSPAGDKHNA